MKIKQEILSKNIFINFNSEEFEGERKKDSPFISFTHSYSKRKNK